MQSAPEEVFQWEAADGAAAAPLTFVISTATPGSASVVDTEILSARVLRNAGAAGTYSVRVQRVRCRFRGRFYVVYEVFGAADSTPTGAAAVTTTGGRECVICITDPRDTVILPCRRASPRLWGSVCLFHFVL